MSAARIIRHAELVSASIASSTFNVKRRGWTLKQVQGDEKSISLEGSVG